MTPVTIEQLRRAAAVLSLRIDVLESRLVSWMYGLDTEAVVAEDMREYAVLVCKAAIDAADPEALLADVLAARMDRLGYRVVIY